jgi:putative hydrolase of the HAD superfamily
MLAGKEMHRKACGGGQDPGVIRALLFDAAGTLLEPAEPVAMVYARFFRRHGGGADPAAVRSAFAAAFGGLAGPAYAAHADGDAAEREWWREVVFATMRGCGVAPLDRDACFRDLFDHYAEPAAWSFYPETRTVLEQARAEGFRLAVVSNFDRRLHRLLDGLPFECVLTSADAGTRKPDPAIFVRVLRQLGLEPAEVFHAGDSAAADIAGAAGLGIPAYLVQRPHADLRGFLSRALEMRSAAAGEKA